MLAVRASPGQRRRLRICSDGETTRQNEPLRMAHRSFCQDPARPRDNRFHSRCTGLEQPGDLGRARTAGGKLECVQFLSARVTKFRHGNLLCVSNFLGDHHRICVPRPPAIKTHVCRERRSSCGHKDETFVAHDFLLAEQLPRVCRRSSRATKVLNPCPRVMACPARYCGRCRLSSSEMLSAGSGLWNR